jgi:alkylresorcinol/alkylpyrone synthase
MLAGACRYQTATTERAMKVIGAGFTRTGTMSIKAALEKLGAGPCLHPLDSESPAGPSATGPREPRTPAASGSAADWRRELGPWRAAFGWLGARHYRELMAAFPEAVVLLSVRDPDEWYASYASCVRATRELALAGGPSLTVAEVAASEALMLRDGPIWRDILDGWVAEREHALACYQRHNDEVASTVPAARLLVYDVRDGWAPLCDLLGAEPPAAPFPHLNTQAAFRRRFAVAAPPARPALDAGASVVDALDALPRAASQPRIAGLATSDPARSYSQAEVLELLGLRGDPFAEGIFARCGVRRRHLELIEGAGAGTLQGRTSRSEELLLAHAVRAVDARSVDLREVSTVISASLYSLGGPTIAHRLVEHYDLDPATDKYHVVGVGCASAVPLLRLAAQTLHERPGGKALVVAVETMSGLLTGAAPGDARAKVIGSAIFGDGAAAAVIDGGSSSGPAVVASMVHQIPGTLDAVRMELSDDDGYLHLARELPDLAAAGLDALVERFLAPLGLTRYAIDHWIVHPGGRRILECVQAALALSDAQVEISYDMLAQHGNVGTPSIFYVLAETIARRRPSRGDRGLVITVGPGVTVGLMLLRW